MAPLPKRKHSKMRKGKRLKTRALSLPKLVSCHHCGVPKIPHNRCKKCGKQ